MRIWYHVSPTVSYCINKSLTAHACREERGLPLTRWVIFPRLVCLVMMILKNVLALLLYNILALALSCVLINKYLNMTLLLFTIRHRNCTALFVIGQKIAPLLSKLLVPPKVWAKFFPVFFFKCDLRFWPET